eukprot:scaffold52342_cov75-Phaeocystis_antarctica.AAC.4
MRLACPPSPSQIRRVARVAIVGDVVGTVHLRSVVLAACHVGAAALRAASAVLAAWHVGAAALRAAGA